MISEANREEHIVDDVLGNVASEIVDSTNDHTEQKIVPSIAYGNKAQIRRIVSLKRLNLQKNPHGSERSSENKEE